jgi:hypothetical protein
VPTGRLTTPEEVAIAGAYLIEEGTFCAGEVLSINSGTVI